MKKIEKQRKALLFLYYITSQGFDENYEQILELNQDVEGSVSLYLDGCKQFLLSTKVNYDELHSVGIDGAYGYLKSDGLYVPKTIESDEHFYGRWNLRTSHLKHFYSYPKISDFNCEYDATISNGIYKKDNFDLILNSGMDFFIGDILDTKDLNYISNRSSLLHKLKELSLYGVKPSFDNVSKDDNEYILYKRIKQ